jgi:hypothetical protein
MTHAEWIDIIEHVFFGLFVLIFITGIVWG